MNTKNLTSESLFQQAEAEFEQARYQSAIAYYSAVLQQDAQHTPSYIDRALCKQQLCQYEDALQDINAALQLLPNTAQYYCYRGDIRDDMGQYEAAIKDYELAIALDTSLAQAYLSRGLAYSNLNEHAKAIKDYDEAIRLDPENDSAWNNRGYSKNQLSCWDEAIRDLDQAIALDENSFTAYAHRGAAKLGLGLTQAGVRDIAQALLIQPNYARAFDYLDKARTTLFGAKRGSIVPVKSSEAAVKINSAPPEREKAVLQSKRELEGRIAALVREIPILYNASSEDLNIERHISSQGAQAVISQATVRLRRGQPDTESVAVKTFRNFAHFIIEFRVLLKILLAATQKQSYLLELRGVSFEVDDRTQKVQASLLLPLAKQSLSELLAREKQQKQLNLSQKVRICKQIAHGVATLHTLNVVHKDLKPQNVLLMADGNVRIADFGIAEQDVEATQSESLRAATYRYAAPESICDGQSFVSTRTDVWSLGMLFFELFTLRRPWFWIQGNGATQILALLESRVDPIEGIPDIAVKNEVIQAIPANVLSILRRCFSYDHRKRPHMTEICSQL